MTLCELDLRNIKRSYVAYLNDLDKFRRILDIEEMINLKKELEMIITRLVDAKVSPKAIRYFQRLKERILERGYIDRDAWATLKSFKDEIH